MTYVVVIVSLLLVIAGLALFISIKRNLQLAEKVDELGDQVEESLDIIDDCYHRIVKATEIPVLSDEPVIQQLVADIKHTRHAVLLVANKLITFDQDDEEDDAA